MSQHLHGVSLPDPLALNGITLSVRVYSYKNLQATVGDNAV